MWVCWYGAWLEGYGFLYGACAGCYGLFATARRSLSLSLSLSQLVRMPRGSRLFVRLVLRLLRLLVLLIE